MTTVNLGSIGGDVDHRRAAVCWLLDRYGPAGDAWTVNNLADIKFKNDKDATLFILRWS